MHLDFFQYLIHYKMEVLVVILCFDNYNFIMMMIIYFDNFSISGFSIKLGSICNNFFASQYITHYFLYRIKKTLDESYFTQLENL